MVAALGLLACAATTEAPAAFASWAKEVATGGEHFYRIDVEGPFVRNDGAWHLAAREGGGTRATYSVDVELKRFLPGFLERRLIEESLPAMLKAFRDRAEALAR